MSDDKKPSNQDKAGSKQAEKTEAGKNKEIKVSPKLKKLIDEVGKLSVLELAELVKALEDKFGVSAAAPTAVIAAGSAQGAGPGAGAEEAEEKSEFNVILTASGANKIAAIKAVREVKPDLGLKEAKDLVEGAPKELLTGVKKEEAEEAKKKLESAGAQVELK